MQLPARVEYPLIAVGALHGRRVARPTATGGGLPEFVFSTG